MYKQLAIQTHRAPLCTCMRQVEVLQTQLDQLEKSTLTATHYDTHYNALQYTLQRTASNCNMPRHTHAPDGSSTIQMDLPKSRPHRNALQHAVTHCNTLQHSATRCNSPVHIHASGGSESIRAGHPHCNTREHTTAHCNSPVRMQSSGGSSADAAGSSRAGQSHCVKAQQGNARETPQRSQCTEVCVFISLEYIL